jgi:hypothetical protein
MNTPTHRPSARLSARLATLVAAAVGLAGAAHAADVRPASYDMPNGYGQASGGSFNYWDASYDGAGDRTVDHAPLTGGRGDLTDGVIATESWYLVENVAGTGPYVGWNSPTPWVITFRFEQSTVFDSLTVWHDDANTFGDISPPAAVTVTVGALSQRFEIVDPAADTPFGSVLALGPGWQGDTVVLSLERANNGFMVSEVSFQAAPVPEPAAWATLAAGLLALTWRRTGAQRVAWAT